MTNNLFQAFLALNPVKPLLVGKVVALNGAGATIKLPGDALIEVRGAANLEQSVFVWDGVIQGQAPTLDVVLIEV